jgi:hypothetical protein
MGKKEVEMGFGSLQMWLGYGIVTPERGEVIGYEDAQLFIPVTAIVAFLATVFVLVWRDVRSLRSLSC